MYKSILVPVDGSASAEYALAVAVTLAGRLGSTLHIVHVFGERVTDALPVYGVTGSAARAAAEHYVQGMADRFRPALAGRLTSSVIDGSPVRTRLCVARRSPYRAAIGTKMGGAVNERRTPRRAERMLP